MRRRFLRWREGGGVNVGGQRIAGTDTASIPNTPLDVPEGTPRPLTILSEYTRRYPKARKQTEAAREARGKGNVPNWPEWCYLPFEFAQRLVFARHGAGFADHGRVVDAPALGALMPWRMNKGIYRFDPDVMASLWNTPLTGDIPTMVFRHLPEWCCYVDLASCFSSETAFEPSGIGKGTKGFFVYLSWDTRQHHTELWFVLDTDKGLIPTFLNLRAATLEDCWLSTERETLLLSGAPEKEVESVFSSKEAKEGAAVVAKQLAPFLNATIYLCSAEPEIVPAGGRGDDRRRRRRPGNPEPRRTKKHGEKLFAAQEVRKWDVAWRIGAALRRRASESAAREEAENGGSTGTRKRPHIRRGHWHSYWIGSGEQKEKVVKWLPPLAVNADTGEELPAVIRPVE